MLGTSGNHLLMLFVEANCCHVVATVHRALCLTVIQSYCFLTCGMLMWCSCMGVIGVIGVNVIVFAFWMALPVCRMPGMKDY